MSSTPSSNVVTITDQSGTLKCLHFSGAYMATAGQACSLPPRVVQSGRKFTVTFDCNRKASSAVASSFNALCGGVAHEYAASHGGGTPNDLNFYFGLTACFSTTHGDAEATFYMAQGHSGGDNNWWIGGNVVESSVPNLAVPLLDCVEVLYLPLTGSVSSYNLGTATLGA